MKPLPFWFPALLASLVLPLPAARDSDSAALAASLSPLLTAQQLDEFTAHYYDNPRPDLISSAIAALGPSGFLGADGRVGGRYWLFVGFYAEVFAANPDRVAEWQAVGAKDRMTRACLKAAEKFGRPGALLAVEGRWITRPGAILTLGNSWGSANDARWGAFFASGNPAYLRRFVAQLADFGAPDSDGTGIGAMWSLARNAPAHPLVRATLEEARVTADSSIRVLLDDVLTKDLETLRGEILAKIPHSVPTGGVPGYAGLRDMGYFGPVNGRLELPPARQ